MATVIHAKKSGFPINLFDYGTVANWNGTTGTDNSAAMQAAIDYAVANNIGVVHIPMAKGERYYVATKLNILVGNFSVTGDSPVQNLSRDLKSYITAAVGIGAILDYGNGQNLETGAFYLQGIAFYKTGTKITTAVKISMDNNGPHRGVTFRNISAFGFVNAIELNPPTAGFLAAANVDIESCNFTGCTNAVNAVKECFGLRFVGNQAEDGASIIGKFSAGVTITDNMLESNTNCVNIDSDAPNVLFENNYCEGSLGDYLLRVKGGNAYSTLEIGKNFGLDSAQCTDLYLIEGVIRANLKQREFIPFRSTPVTLKNAFLVQGSSFKGHGFYWIPTTGFSAYLLAHEYGIKPDAGASFDRLMNLGADIQLTPFGETRTGLSITGFNSSNDKTLTISYTSADNLVFCALVSVINSAGEKPQVTFFDTGDVEMRTTGELRFYKQNDSEWYLYTCSIKPTTTGTTVKVRWGSDEEAAGPTASTLKIAAIGIYKVPAANIETLNSQTRIYVKPFNPFYSTKPVTGTSDAMTAGTVTVNTAAVTADSKIYLSHAAPIGTLGWLSVGTIVPGVSFVINSTGASDLSTVNWLIIN